MYDDLDETLKFFVANAQTIKDLFTADVDVTITSKDTVLEEVMSNEIPIENSKGRKLKPNEPMIQIMKTNKAQLMHISKEYYGIPFTAKMVPIRNEKGVVVGGIAISRSISKQTILKEVAQKFATSSEEISASTEELMMSATNFNEYMTELSTSQHEMSMQVEETTKILDMINGVAKNTRVLGFNAGIEAARAGEYGRGFSVVAKEITRLADQSADSVNEIRQLLQELNSKVVNVVNVVNNAMDISTNQSDVIHEIAQSIQILTDGAEEIEKLAQKI